ncbi:H/ACA ribonucleoprotein complex subunit GAR1 [Cucumispora dikerogammari]|nr:H/ACA ribonucleoprotein complex subunit GAR1 [Cucumispora dikerogammari]
MAYSHSNNKTNNKFRNSNQKFNKSRKPEGIKTHLGDYLYTLNNQNQIVIAIRSPDFPFPNSVVFQNDIPIGKVDEVFGKLDESFASVIVDTKFEKSIPFFCNKYLKREWLLPRDVTLSDKEKRDSKKKNKVTDTDNRQTRFAAQNKNERGGATRFDKNTFVKNDTNKRKEVTSFGAKTYTKVDYNKEKRGNTHGKNNQNRGNHQNKRNTEKGGNTENHKKRKIIKFDD